MFAHYPLRRRRRRVTLKPAVRAQLLDGKVHEFGRDLYEVHDLIIRRALPGRAPPAAFNNFLPSWRLNGVLSGRVTAS